MHHRFAFLVVALAGVVARGASGTQTVAHDGPEFQGPYIAAVRPSATLADQPVVKSLAFNRNLLTGDFAAFQDPKGTRLPLFIMMDGISGEPQAHRTRHAVIGGLIGGTAGILACTAISNIAKDQGSGFSTCDAKAYIGFGLAGAAVGALIGWVI